MENEYATFGLPNDPMNQPRPRGWFSRNWWWVVPTTLLIPVLLCGGCGGFVFWFIGALKSSEPYQMALERVRSNPQVIAQLHEPIIDTTFLPTGNFSFQDNNGIKSGAANFSFTVAGSEGTASVHAEAVCRNGKWYFHVLEVTPSGARKAISLLADEKPEKAEAVEK